MRVLNKLGHGFLEKVYERALCAELKSRGIRFDQQKRFDLYYDGAFVGEYIPDLIVSDKIIVETKTVDRIGPAQIGQVLNYLKMTGCALGLILNFKRPTLEWKRVIF